MGSRLANKGIQIQEYTYDFAVDGGAVSTIDLSSNNVLPEGAVVMDCWARVITACTSGGSATIAWGPTSDADGLSGTAIAVASFTDGAVFNASGQGAALLWDDTNDHQIYYEVGATSDDFKITIGTAALTAGKIIFAVQYYIDSEVGN